MINFNFAGLGVFLIWGATKKLKMSHLVVGPWKACGPLSTVSVTASKQNARNNRSPPEGKDET